MDKILITGASGFIGSFIVEEALKRNMEVWAAVRRSSSREWLQDERIHFIELNLSSEDELKKQLQDHVFDYVVHAAGVTKCLRKEQFYAVNTEGTKHLVNVLLALQMPLKKFIYLSSLSIFGAIREQQPYEAIRETDTPQPNTEYGKSKLAAEAILKGCSKEGLEATLPYVILRPTGVYGPREKDYFMMAKSIKQHIDFAVGYQKQVITFVYVRDLVGAIFAAIGKAGVANGKTYLVSDGYNYDSRAFSDLIQKELDIKHVLHIKAPLWLLWIISTMAEGFSKLTHKPSTLNGDKYRIMCQRNWQCDISPLKDELGYIPEWPLERGVKECMDWYKENKWI